MSPNPLSPAPTHILHLGHQPTDIAGIATALTTEPAAFDPALDTNGLAFSGNRDHAAPFLIAHPPAAGDLWLGFRYVPPNTDAGTITRPQANFLDFLDADLARIAQVRPSTATSRYHAIVHGDQVVEGPSSFIATPASPVWIDVRLHRDPGVSITLDLHVDGMQVSSATAPDTLGRGPCTQVLFANAALHSNSNSRTWHYAHVALLDGVSTIGRRFIRRLPAAAGIHDDMTGSLAALADGNIATRVASTAPGQRLSFTLAGPALPPGAALAGLHLRATAQAGTAGPTALAGFLRMGGTNHDADPQPAPPLAPAPLWSSWTLNPADNSPWTAANLPAEMGILSA